MKTISIVMLLIGLSLGVLAQNGMVVDQKTGKISYSSIGTVTFVKGKVYRTKIEDKTSEEIGINFPIFEKDIIQTEEKSIIKIEMNDATIITLGPNSHFNFNNYNFRTKSERDADYDLKMGKARVEVPIKVAKGKLNFNTRTVSLGVRGTEFLMQQEIDKNGNSEEQIALIEGKLEVIAEGSSPKVMEPGDHYLLKKDSSSNEIADKMVKLDQKFFDYLKAESLSKNAVKPFLSKLNKQLLNSSSESSSPGESGNNSKNFKKVKNFWKNSLEKLNKKLKGNNE